MKKTVVPKCQTLLQQKCLTLRGQSLVEYLIIASVVIVALIAVSGDFGHRVAEVAGAALGRIP